MAAYSEDQLRLSIAGFLRHEQSLEALAVDLGQALLEGDSELAWDLELILDEYAAGHWSEDEFVGHLWRLLENVVVDFRENGSRRAASAPLLRLDLGAVVY